MGSATERPEGSARLREPFAVGPYTVEPARNRITGPGGAVSIEPKIIDVLCALADRQGEVVARSTLIDVVWGREFGADESLSRAISQLRKVLGDSREDPRFLETIAKRGYRLVMPVLPAEPPAEDDVTEPVSVGAQSLPWHRRLPLSGRLLAGFALVLAVVGAILLLRPRTPPAAPVVTADAPLPAGIGITVIPFETNVADLRAKRIAEQLATDLSRVRLFHVRLATASAAGGTAALRYGIRGSVEQIGGRLHTSVQLFDGTTGDQLWGQSFDQADDGSAPDRLARAISAAVYPPLMATVKAALATKPILSLAPWELILLATWVPGTDGVFLAPHSGGDSVWLQRRAIALDPDYAPAHAAMARQLAYEAMFDPAADSSVLMAEARRHAVVANAKAPYDADVLFEVATYDRFVGDRTAAVGALQRVVELRPEHPVARIDLLYAEGQCGPAGDDAAMRLKTLEAEMPANDPVRWVVLSHLADLALAHGEYDRAREAAAASRKIVKQTWNGITLAAALAALGRDGEARAISAEVRLEWPHLDYAWFVAHGLPHWCLGGPQDAGARRAFLQLAKVAP